MPCYEIFVNLFCGCDKIKISSNFNYPRDPKRSCVGKTVFFLLLKTFLIIKTAENYPQRTWGGKNYTNSQAKLFCSMLSLH